MKKLDCSQAEHWIVEELDGELSPKLHARLDDHISECPDCARFKEETRAVLAMVAEEGPPDPGAEFWTRYNASLEGRWQAKYQRSAEDRWHWGLGKWVWAPMAVAATVLLVVVGIRLAVEVVPDSRISFKPTDQAAQQLEKDTDQTVQQIGDQYTPVVTEQWLTEPSFDSPVPENGSQTALNEESVLSWCGIEAESYQLVLWSMGDLG